jgi:carotenoid cleavage dioxygenase-like enzyme
MKRTSLAVHNVNLTRLGDAVVAMTETPLPVVFDPQTLRAAGVASKAPGQHTTAHPHLDPKTGEGLFYAVKFGPRSSYRLYARGDRSRQRQIAKLPVSRPAYMHSFGITERYAVLTECPLVVNPIDLARGGRPFIENYRWEPRRGTPFLVFDRRTGELAARVEAEPFFCFHHVNAFEDGDGELVVDLTAYEDDEIVRALYLGNLRAGGRLPRPELRRYRVPLGGGAARVETLAEGMELPRINYRRCNGRRYRFAYGNGLADGDAFVTLIQKTDVEAATTSEWAAANCYPGEPVFVPRPEASSEDDGVLLSLVLDAAAGRSFLLVLDARDLGEIARANAPHAVPFGFHGQFLSG